MRELIFLPCDMHAAPKAGYWARGALRHAGLSASRAQKAASKLTDAYKAAVSAFNGAAAQEGAEVMLVLSDESGELAFELIADGDQARGDLVGKPGAMGSLWDAIERRVAGDGVTCLRMRAIA